MTSYPSPSVTEFKFRCQDLPPPSPFSRRTSSRGDTTALNDQNLIADSGDSKLEIRTKQLQSSRSSNDLGQVRSLVSAEDTFAHRKAMLQSKNMSKSMPCFREIRTDIRGQYNRNLGTSIKVDNVVENPDYDQQFKNLSFSDGKL